MLLIAFLVILPWTGTGSTSQTELGSGVATDSLSRHQARLQAAAAAAAIYEKSYVYPSATSFVRYGKFLLGLYANLLQLLMKSVQCCASC
jgi:hypothetical protein